jgi:hypothetical protein
MPQILKYLGYKLEKIYMPVRAQSFRLVYPKYFYKEDTSLPPVHYTDILHNAHVKTIKEDKTTWSVHTTYNDETRISKFFAYNSFNPDRPTFIFHLGAGHSRYSIQTRILFGKKLFEGFNVFFIEAQHHSNRINYILNCLDTFLHLQETIIGSVLTVEEIVSYVKSKSTKSIIVSGLSTGGTIATLHHFHFDSAHAYFPIVAFPNIPKLFHVGPYKHLIHKNMNTVSLKNYIQSFEIPKKYIEKEKKSSLFPIIATKDDIVPFSTCKEFWKNYKALYCECGHFSIAFYAKEIREFLYAHLPPNTF